jgi:putative transposase
MARHPRLIYADVAVHIVQRGNNRIACFRADTDYLTYLALLRHSARKYGVGLHAYCLMTNHVHLLVTPSSAEACGPFMRDLGRGYVPYFNRRYERTGTLWEGRFRSCIAESARYVLACYRYVELNPVRAGMVADPADHPWSSHRANTGLQLDDSLVAHAEFEALGAQAETRRTAYRDFFATPLETELLRTIREATQGGYPLASEAFKARLGAHGGLRTERGKPGPKAASMLTE